MKKQIPIWPVIGVAIVIVAAAAFMVLVRPKRAESGRLDEQIAEMQMKVTAAQLASRPQQQATTIKVADVFEVSKAMPDTDDMPGIILDLNSVAEATGIKFELALPHVAFHRHIGEFRDVEATTTGELLDGAKWTKMKDDFLPSDADGDFIAGLMQPVVEPGKFASWIAPPKVGIDNKSGDFEYVKIA